MQDFSGYTPTWCPGCGDWGIGIAIKSALAQMGLSPSDVGVVFGIGCSGNMNDFLNAYAIHGLHGRAIPTAIGYKLANHKMPIIVVAGDGDCYGEGGNHFLHACRGNHDITVIIHDNRVYGLTTGQVAPTAMKGALSKSTPYGLIESPIDPLGLALTQGATFISQSFAGDAQHMISMIKSAINHKGFSLVNVLQPCVTFNKINGYQYYRKRVYKLIDNKVNNKDRAMKIIQDIEKEKYPLGIIYQNQQSSYHEQLPQLTKQTLIKNEKFVDFKLIERDFI
ncbi:2-oxoacid:ferredoxin oxidoreductase subunit beta [Candidatus Roizmanbacteria bacterium]|nr:2-oxoacid:ferredoxin oxidoreductase subunit beta [Candidatus Roizmanbacteria bacterium]